MSGLWWGNAADGKAFLSAVVSWFSTSTPGKLPLRPEAWTQAIT